MNIPKDKCTWDDKSRCFVIEASDIYSLNERKEPWPHDVTLTGNVNTMFSFHKTDWADPSHEDVAGWRFIHRTPGVPPINLLIIND